jgi:hypothetical protein
LPDSFKEQAAQIGSSSGRLIDKVDEYQIKLTRADVVSAPLVVGATGSVECRVLQMMAGGDHTVVVAEVVEMHFPEDEDAKRPVLFNWGSKTYFGMSKDLVREPEKKDLKENSKDSRENGKDKEATKADGKDTPSPKETREMVKEKEAPSSTALVKSENKEKELPVAKA